MNADEADVYYEHPTALRLRVLASAELLTGPSFAGKPDRWWDAHLFRCENEHVSSWLVGRETGNGDTCPACGSALVWLTFPEDRDGPL